MTSEEDEFMPFVVVFPENGGWDSPHPDIDPEDLWAIEPTAIWPPGIIIPPYGEVS